MADPYEIPLKDYESAIFFGSNINIVRDYKWHTGLATDMPPPHVPRLILREFEIANSNLWSGLERSGAMIMRDNPYAGMYVSEPTGFRFILPYLSDFTWKASVTWEPVEAGGNGDEKKGNAIQRMANAVTDAVDSVIKFGQGVSELTNSSTAFVENTAERWKNTDVTPVSTKFSLINTNSNPEAWMKNYRFCQYLKAACLHDQRNTTKASPPPIYTLLIPGLIYSPACYMSGLEIKQKGSVMPMNVLLRFADGAPPPLKPPYEPASYQEIYIPDSWEIKIDFKWLVMPSRQTQIYGMNAMRWKVPAITDAGGDTPMDLTYGAYSIGNELGQEPADNAALYNTQSNAKLFDLKNATQRDAKGAITDG